MGYLPPSSPGHSQPKAHEWVLLAQITMWLVAAPFVAAAVAVLAFLIAFRP